MVGLFVISNNLFAQVGISTDNSAPDSSALLDVKSSTKGILVPRMTRVQRNAISSPAEGLMVYCTNCGTDGSLSIFSNGSWKTFSHCNISSPVAGTHLISPGQIIWNWISSSGATGYKWNTSPDYETATDIGSSLSKTETGTYSGTTYTRYIWAYSSCGESGMTTLSQTVPSVVPAAPTSGTHFSTQISISWN